MAEPTQVERAATGLDASGYGGAAFGIQKLVAALAHLADRDELDGLTEVSAGIRRYLAEKHNDERYFDGAVVFVHPSEM
jgi:hypothetical protein